MARGKLIPSPPTAGGIATATLKPRANDDPSPPAVAAVPTKCATSVPTADAAAAVSPAAATEGRMLSPAELLEEFFVVASDPAQPVSAAAVVVCIRQLDILRVSGPTSAPSGGGSTDLAIPTPGAPHWPATCVRLLGETAAVPVAAAAVLRLLAEFERGRPDAALLHAEPLALAVQHALVSLTAHLAEHPDAPATGIATAVRCILTVIFRDAQAYKSVKERLGSLYLSTLLTMVLTESAAAGHPALGAIRRHACEVANDLLDRAPRNVASLHERFSGATVTASAPLVRALIASGDFRLQRLLTELLFRGSSAPAAAATVTSPGPVRMAIAAQLHERSPAAATAFAALRGAHFEADCRTLLVQLNRAVGLVQSVQAQGVWYNGQPLGAPLPPGTPSPPPPAPTGTRRGKPSAPVPAPASAPPLFWVDFNSHCISFDARLPGEDDHDLVEVPYTKMTEFDFVAPPTATATARWADGAGGNTRCLRLMLASPPAMLNACGGQDLARKVLHILLAREESAGVPDSLRTLLTARRPPRVSISAVVLTPTAVSKRLAATSPAAGRTSRWTAYKDTLAAFDSLDALVDEFTAPSPQRARAARTLRAAAGPTGGGGVDDDAAPVPTAPVRAPASLAPALAPAPVPAPAPAVPAPASVAAAPPARGVLAPARGGKPASVFDFPEAPTPAVAPTEKLQRLADHAQPVAAAALDPSPILLDAAAMAPPTPSPERRRNMRLQRPAGAVPAAAAPTVRTDPLPVDMTPPAHLRTDAARSVDRGAEADPEPLALPLTSAAAAAAPTTTTTTTATPAPPLGRGWSSDLDGLSGSGGAAASSAGFRRQATARMAPLVATPTTAGTATGRTSAYTARTGATRGTATPYDDNDIAMWTDPALRTLFRQLHGMVEAEDAKHADDAERTLSGLAGWVVHTVDAMLLDHDATSSVATDALMRRVDALAQARADRRGRLDLFAQQHFAATDALLDALDDRLASQVHAATASAKDVAALQTAARAGTKRMCADLDDAIQGFSR